MELCLLLISTYQLSNSGVAHFAIFFHMCFNGSPEGSSFVVDCCGLKSLQQMLQCALVLWCTALQPIILCMRMKVPLVVLFCDVCVHMWCC